MAWDNTDVGVISLSDQVSERLNGMMSYSNKVSDILGTNTLVPEIQRTNAEGNSEVKTSCLEEAMKNKLTVRGKLLQAAHQHHFYLGVGKPVESLNGSSYKKKSIS